MKFWRLRCFWLMMIGVMFLQGCASTPSSATGPAASDFGSDNLDLLFATEFPVASKEEAVAKAARAYRNGEFDEALFYLVRALKFDTSDTGVLAQIGNLHVQQGNGVLAARAFQFALQQEPQHAASLEGMGLLYFKAGNNDAAQEYLELAIASAPNLWRSHNALGVISDRQKNYLLAQSFYNAALEIQPLADSVLINRGYSKFLNKDYHGAALDFYAVTERSDSEKAWRNLALVYAKQGWYEDAIETFLRIGEEHDAYNETGAIAMENGDIEAAFRYLSDAVRLSPTYFAEAENNLAQLRKKNSRAHVTMD